MFKTLLSKLRSIIAILTSKSAHVIYQKDLGTDPKTVGFGQGDLRDLVLFATAIKNMYNGYVAMVNEAAADAGELHSLQALRDAVKVLEEDAKK